mgnify:CR=1 FL=1|jgi:nucleoside-diphosphate-sugar epimerase
MSQPLALIAGGAGFVGSVTVRRLLADGWRVRVLDNFLYDQNSLTALRDDPRLEVLVGDVSDTHALLHAVRDVDAVVYLAEIVGDVSCARHPALALKTNYLAPTTLAHLAAYYKVPRFVYASSCSVYGAVPEHAWLTEEDACDPVSLYGELKVRTEQALQAVPGLRPTILRFSTVFGHSPRPRFDLVANLFAHFAHFRQGLTVFGGGQWRPYAHVQDIARAIACVLAHPQEQVGDQIFNVGDDDANYTIAELAARTVEAFPGTRVDVKPREARDRRDYRVCFAKLASVTGFRTQHTLDDGLIELRAALMSGKVAPAIDRRNSNLAALTAKLPPEI